MKTIYVVTRGSYSDYGIKAIFNTKELAQAYIDSFKYDSYNEMSIEEWDLNPNSKELKKGRKPYFVRMDKAGIATEYNHVDSSYGFNGGTVISFTLDKQSMNCYCWAKDEKHAIKIANEKRVQFIALDRWGLS